MFVRIFFRLNPWARFMNDNSILWEKTSVIPTIATIHAKRIGWTRVYIGGFSMYLSIPIWILMHTIVSALCFLGFVSPLLRLPKIDVSKYLVMGDRALIKELYFIDRLNCEFCSYANGLTTLINAEIDQLAAWHGQKDIVTWILLLPAFLLATLATLVTEIFCIRLVYDHLIAGMLGLHTSRFGVIYSELYRDGYAKQFNFLGRHTTLFVKTVFLRLEKLLEQIESSWCPIKHIKKTKEYQYPKHHENFYEQDEVYRMRMSLDSDGTVSKKKPLY